MAGLIKKQILKHLSKFTKNLSADKINLSTLRGEGELSNLELDCIALQNVMNLPTWLQIKRANCNKVHVKIAWTKLKTMPICIYLDAVEVEMITCEKPREPNGPSPIQASASSGDTSYGFTEKVLEGMTVNINSISVNFKSAAFTATFQLSQLLVISTNPNWDKTDLRYSRITDKTLGQVLTFKKISWQTMRIVADAIRTNEKNTITPLRLITNQSEIMMTFRRRTSDCYVLASRLHVHFDDLLWVLTDSQVQSALLCVKSLSDTIERSKQQMRELGLDKSQDAQQMPSKPQPTNMQGIDEQSSLGKFEQHTIDETSYHIDFDRVDLHICEEGTPEHHVHRKNLHGGAIQIALHNLKVDHYPYHKAAYDRKHFRDYGDTMMERHSWAEAIIKQFRRDYVELRKAVDATGNAPLNQKKSIRLVESCFSVRLTDIDIHEVTTSNSKKHATGRLLNSTRKELHLPEEMPLFHFIRTEYYYPDGRDYPAPHNNIFMQLNAPRFNAHWDSLLWLNRLSLTTVQAVQKMLEDLGILNTGDDEDEQNLDSIPQPVKEEEHVDIRIQILMPKVFIPGPISTHCQQPHGLEIQVSRAAVTNCRLGPDCFRQHLKKVLNQLEKLHFSRNPESFPSDKDIDMPFMHKILQKHAVGDDMPLKLTLEEGNTKLTGSALKSLAINDIWSVELEQVWIDYIMPKKIAIEQEDDAISGGFLGKSSPDPIANGLHMPFLDSFPATMWIGKSSGNSDGGPRIASPGHAIESNGLLSPSLENVSMSKMDSSDSTHSTTNPASLSNGPCATKDYSSPSSEAPSHRRDSPRSVRNRRLRDYYRVDSEDPQQQPKVEDTMSHDSRDQISVSSSASSRKQKAISTHILVHTDKSLGLQLDHHQYMFMLRLLDMVEEVGKHLDRDSELILNSPPSSSFSTPSHSASNASSVSSVRVNRKRSKTISTTSVRLSAPEANLYLILRPAPENAHKDEVDENLEKKTDNPVNIVPSPKEDAISVTSSSTDSESLNKKSRTIGGEGDSEPKSSQQPRTNSTIRDTPPLSECESDSISVHGSDNISILGDSTISPGGIYPHEDAVTRDELPNIIQLSSPLGEITPLKDIEERKSPKNNSISQGIATSLSKQKSGSLSTLTGSNSGSVDTKLQIKQQLQFRNHSSDNLTVTMMSDHVSFSSSMVGKSSSSGYDSGSYESLPPPMVRNLARSSLDRSSPRSSHSHSSSDASDQFVMIQVDEHGRGMDDNGTLKNVKKSKVSTADTSSIKSETSSMSSIGFTVQSSSDSKTTDEPESNSSCALVDSQITVTNTRSSTPSLGDESLSSGEKSPLHSTLEKNQKETKKPAVPMSSLVQIHVSKGVELSVDSNDHNDSVVKIAATEAIVTELGAIETEKVDSIFVAYTQKKTSRSSTPRSRSTSASKMTTTLSLPSPQICLRVDSGPLAGRFTPAAAKVGHIQISAKGVPLTLKASTLANLGAFVEDEALPTIVPMKIEAEDVKLTIEDDMPPAYEVTPPGPPITLHVHSASVQRTDDGTFHVTTSSSGKLPSFSPKAAEQSMELHGLSPEKGVDENVGTGADLGVGRFASPLDNLDVTTVMTPETPTNHQEVENGIPQSIKSNPGTPHFVNGVDHANSVMDMADYEELLEKFKNLEKERDALHSALCKMQEDLISSENERSSLKSRLS